MRLLVTMETGEQRVVDLEPPLTVTEGTVLDRLIDGNGVEHFFTKQGAYDGWGCCVRGTRAEGV